MKNQTQTGVCIVVENLPVPLDRRVWKEACALREAGYRVSVICPKGRGYSASHEYLDGIEIYRHTAWEAPGVAGYLLEYSWSLMAELFLTLKVFARTRFRVLQACNPPDTIFLIALILKPFKVRFIFDHHDLAPELFETKFGSRKRVLAALVRLAEWMSFRTACVSIATNESFKEIAISRGKKPTERVFVVRNCPEHDKLRPVRVNEEPTVKQKLRIVYVGFMAQQDGLELLLEAIEHIVMRKKRKDVEVVLVGGGPILSELMLLAAHKGLNSFITFTGQVSHDEVVCQLSRSDIGVVPDPKTAVNDKMTMIKIFEYMSVGLPIVQFDLKESRRAAGNAALYAIPNDPVDLAERIIDLLDCGELRRQLGSCGRQRVEHALNWATEKASLLDAYSTALSA